jgi:AraC-like DNA-binding protein
VYVDAKRCEAVARHCDIRRVGVSAHRWLVLRRIERAKALMLTTQSPLSDIALEAGFSDQASFNRTFRQFVGISPGRWRRELAEG